ncbi:Activating signal cointegrator 1 [Strongyloides ratti]|uniref:Activating signal cointegrator 1 n=1 Tax=Strongyloides ratti TaxID=34506 RepID=A0A090L6A9_STRRB|nr:Activating signal cointegrator 1 [Strongyloides ratti]CEF63648.1 Activating signal cointegrator 1 [Strongyloides ratti]
MGKDIIPNIKTNSALSDGLRGLKSQIKPGRILCDCMARDHPLIGNCLGCGLIVCEQQRSGPCLFCSRLVVSKDEWNILGKNDNDSVELMMKLTAEDSDNTLSRIKNLEKALETREQLLEADSDSSHRNKVHDLQGDYIDIESNTYLTNDERQQIESRKAELDMLHRQKKKKIFIDLDFMNEAIKERENNRNETVDYGKDYIIQDILKCAYARLHKLEDYEDNQYEIIPRGNFTPIYDDIYSKNDLKENPKISKEIMSEVYNSCCDEALFTEVDSKGFCLSLEQPLASLLVNGIEKHVYWDTFLDIKGPIYIASATKNINDEKLNEMRIKYKMDFPVGSIIGRCILTSCHSLDEYNDLFLPSKIIGKGDGFVLVFSVFEELPCSIPYLSEKGFTKLNTNLLQTFNVFLTNKYLSL